MRYVKHAPGSTEFQHRGECGASNVDSSVWTGNRSIGRHDLFGGGEAAISRQSSARLKRPAFTIFKRSLSRSKTGTKIQSVDRGVYAIFVKHT